MAIYFVLAASRRIYPGYHNSNYMLLLYNEVKVTLSLLYKAKIITSSNASSLLTMAQATTSVSNGKSIDPWNLPDSYTIFNFAPEEIRSSLHPHWHDQKAPHLMLYYFFGLYYI